MADVWSLGPSTGLSPEGWSSLIGIITAIIGNFLISFALNIQRYAHIRLARTGESAASTTPPHQDHGLSQAGQEQVRIADVRAHVNRAAVNKHDLSECQHEEETEAQQLLNSDASNQISKQANPITKPGHTEAGHHSSYLQSPYWWAGLILMVIGETGNFLAYGFAPASIVSPLGVVALISNCIIAPCLLKERFRKRDLWAVLVSIGGAVTIVLSAQQSEGKLGPNDIWHSITRLAFEVYLGITAAAILVLLWASKRYGQKTILIDLGLVGLFGGYTALSTKGVASLLSDTLWRALTFPITYLLIFVLVASALLQIRYVNRALQRFDSTQVIPVQFVLFTISVIVGSAILYRDFQSTNIERMLKFVGGCLLTFFGVYLITSARPNHSSMQDQPPIKDEESAIHLVDDEESIANGRVESMNELDIESGYSSRVTNGMNPDNTSTSIPSRSSSKQGHSQDAKHHLRRSDHHPHSFRNTFPRPDASSHNLHHAPAWSQSHSMRSSESAASDREHAPTVTTPLISEHSVEPNYTSSRDGLDVDVSSSTTKLHPSPVLPLSRPSTLSRRSMAMLRPGPLMSPLSSSLSAVIANQRRRDFANDHDSSQQLDTPSNQPLSQCPSPERSHNPQRIQNVMARDLIDEYNEDGDGDIGQPFVKDKPADEFHSRNQSRPSKIRSISASLTSLFAKTHETSENSSKCKDASQRHTQN